MSSREPINDDDQQQQNNNVSTQPMSVDDLQNTSSPPQRSETGLAQSNDQCEPTASFNNDNCSMDTQQATPHDQIQHNQPQFGAALQNQGAAAAVASARSKQKNYNATQQTHSTIAELSEAFRMFTNVHGAVHQSVLTAKDLMKAMQQTGMRPSEKDVNAIIQVIDQNQIGNISFDEFASLMGRSVPMEEVDSLQAAFLSIDKNQTGIVSSAAFAELMATYGECSSSEEVSEMLAFADPNGTGHVNYRVFLRMLGLRLS